MNEDKYFHKFLFLVTIMQRANREKLFSTVSTLTTKLYEQRKQRKDLEKQKQKEDWEKYLQTVGQTPLQFGTDELDAAVVHVEDMILKAATDGWESCRISFSAKKEFAYPFFPSNATLGNESFAHQFRKEALDNLFNALRMRNPDLDIECKNNSYTLRFNFE